MEPKKRETRSKPLKLNLTPSMYDRLAELSERYGVSPNAVASMAIAEYVAQKSSVFSLQDRAVSDVVERTLSSLQPLIDSANKD